MATHYCSCSLLRFNILSCIVLVSAKVSWIQGSRNKHANIRFKSEQFCFLLSFNLPATTAGQQTPHTVHSAGSVTNALSHNCLVGIVGKEKQKHSLHWRNKSGFHLETNRCVLMDTVGNSNPIPIWRLKITIVQYCTFNILATECFGTEHVDTFR